MFGTYRKRLEIIGIIFVCFSSVFAYSGGLGTEADPYKIANVDDLLALGGTPTDYNKCFILTADIDLSSCGAFTSAVIAPQGIGKFFSGTFDGAGHKIINLTIDTDGVGKNILGLFGSVEGGEIKNLGLENIHIAGEGACHGGLVGLIWLSSVSNCYSTGVISGVSNIGGLVGENDDGSISNCYSTATVTCGIYSTYVGGLVGKNYLGSISNCYSTGDVTDDLWSECTGGLVGWNSYGSISNCYSTGDVTCVGGEYSGWVGGLAGINEGGTISNCYSTGDVTDGDESDCTGGLVGYNVDGSISNCHSICEVRSGDDSSQVGGLVGVNWYGSVNNCYSISIVTSGAWSDWTGGLVGANDGTIDNCFAIAAVTEGSGIDNSVGGLVGANTGSISNCHVTGTVASGGEHEFIGGLVGVNTLGSVRNCYSTTIVTFSGDPNYVGALAGENYDGTIYSCYFLLGCGPNNYHGIPLTNTQMKQQSSFVGWDFFGETANGTDDIWRMCVNGVYYPHLTWEYSARGDFVCPDGVDFYDLVIFTGQWLLEKLSYDVVPGTGDGIVNFLDWAVFANNWQGDMSQLAEFTSQWLKSSAYCADIAPEGGDGVVNMLDFAAFAENWLEGQ